VATALFGAYRSSTPIGLYVAALCLVSLLAVLGIKVTGPVEEKRPDLAAG
jgi:hypothetical protein